MDDNGSECLVSIDGADFKIQEPEPFSPIWYSHKHNGPGLRYEVGVCIQTGWIVWLNGPFAPGENNDLKIFRSGLSMELDDGERVEADKGYRGELQIRVPSDFEGRQEWKWMKGRVLARHEAINGKMKEFKILSSVYRGEREKHYLIFKAVAGIIQSEIVNDRAIFEVDYVLHRYVTW